VWIAERLIAVDLARVEVLADFVIIFVTAQRCGLARWQNDARVFERALSRSSSEVV
jgi:hypothetical protein